MNLSLSKSIKLFAMLLLLSASTACQTQSAPKAVQPDKQTDQQALSAATEQPVTESDTTGDLVAQGKRRTYYLHTPKSYRPGHPMPLVLAFHEFNGTGREMAQKTNLNSAADQKGFIVVYPDAIKRWHTEINSTSGIDDVAFISDLIAHIRQKRDIDPQRTYATGLSNGGIFLQRAACQKPGQIAAFATVAAALPTEIKPSCRSQTPVVMMMINGDADNVVPWSGGNPPQIRVGPNLSLPPVLDVVDFWRQHDRCKGQAETKQLPGDRVEETRYSSCQAGSEVIILTLKGGGHIWPGGSGKSQFLDASSTVLEFFQSHPLGTASQTRLNNQNNL
jgi:polyhydroxybutyrate depolymerase